MDSVPTYDRWLVEMSGALHLEREEMCLRYGTLYCVLQLLYSALLCIYVYGYVCLFSFYFLLYWISTYCVFDKKSVLLFISDHGLLLHILMCYVMLCSCIFFLKTINIIKKIYCI